MRRDASNDDDNDDDDAALTQSMQATARTKNLCVYSPCRTYYSLQHRITPLHPFTKPNIHIFILTPTHTHTVMAVNNVGVSVVVVVVVAVVLLCTGDRSGVSAPELAQKR